MFTLSPSLSLSLSLSLSIFVSSLSTLYISEKLEIQQGREERRRGKEEEEEEKGDFISRFISHRSWRFGLAGESQIQIKDYFQENCYRETRDERESIISTFVVLMGMCIVYIYILYITH